MPWNFRLIKARDFIRTNPAGELDLNTTKGVVRELASLRLPRECDVLIDIREAVDKLSTSDVYATVEEFVKHCKAFRGRKLALLDADDTLFYRNTKFAEDCAQNRGINLRAFTNFEQAMSWLTAEVLLTPDVSDR